MRKRSRAVVLVMAIVVTAVLLTCFASVVSALTPPVTAPATISGVKVFNATTTYPTGVKIAPGAVLSAKAGYSLTMTVNKVETGIVAGKTYFGTVVFTVTPDIIIHPTFGPPQPDAHLRTAVYIEDGVYVPQKSVKAAVSKGSVTNTYANNVKIFSVGPLFNGLMIRGASDYTINNPVIKFTGPGGNDFIGWGAGIWIDGTSNVVVNNPQITTNGVVRTAIWAGGESTLTVNNAYIKTGNPPVPSPEESYGAFMTAVPWPLGLTGTCRSTLAVGAANVTYNDSYIGAAGWGALSTDAAVPDPVYLTANNCTIETLESGYGAYADGNSADVFTDCTFNVADMAVIFTQGDATFDNTVVNSGRFGVMQHSGVSTGNEVLTITNGSVFNTDEASIMIKNSAPIINVDNSTLNPGNGVILHLMLSDDHGSGVVAEGSPTVANFTDMTLTGDIINSMTGAWWKKSQDQTYYFVGGDLHVNFTNSTITGAITTATHTDWFDLNGVDGTVLSPFDESNAYLSSYIGLGKTVYGIADNDHDGFIDPYGVIASFDADSTWVVDTSCALTGLSIADGASITAPAGYEVTMYVNGAETAIVAGDYAGCIVMRVEEVE